MGWLKWLPSWRERREGKVVNRLIELFAKGEEEGDY